MRLFLTGGSGFIGSNAVPHFTRKGWSVLNLDLVAPKDPDQAPYWVKGDIRDRPVLRAILGDYAPDYVINLAADLGADIQGASLKDFTTNIDGVESLIEAVKAAGSVRRTVFVSSLLVCANGYVPAGDEDYCPPGPYGESKVEGERLVRKRGGGEWVIVRPSSVWGPWFEHSYRTFFRLVERGLYFHISRAKHLVKPITYAGNALFMLEKLLLAPPEEVSGQTFYLVDYPEVEVCQWAEAIRRATRARPIPTLPLWTVKAAATVGDVLKWAGWRDAPLSSFRLTNLLTGGHYPYRKTADVVGPLPYSLDAGVAETVQWMREQRRPQSLQPR